MRFLFSGNYTALKNKVQLALSLFLFSSLFVSFTSFAQTDVARGKTATASSEETYNGVTYYARLAVDGDLTGNSRWSSNYSDPQWIRIDLGSNHVVSRVALRWEFASAQNYTVEISTDGTNYTPLFSRSNQAIGSRVDDINCNGIGRYVRMTGTVRTSTYGYSLWAFEVYGVPAVYYTLNTSVLPANGGTIGVNPSTGPYLSGTNVTLTANANAGYRFVNWTGDLTGTTSPATLVMNANRAVTANFAINTYTITPTAGQNGTISPATPQTVEYGDTVSFTMSPATGYIISDVLVDGRSVGALTSYTFSGVTANHTINVTFAPIPNFALTTTILPAGSGTVTLNPAGGSYPSGTQVTMTALPATGYRFVNYTGDITSTNPISSVIMSTARSVNVNFARNTYTITPTAGANGQISPAAPVTIGHGDSLRCTITPNAGYNTADVLVDGVSVGAVSAYIFRGVIANHTISATFTAAPRYTLTTSSFPANSGTITLNPAGGSYPAGTVVTLTASANPGYTFTNWTGDVTDTIAVSTQITMNANRTVTANFQTNTYTITPTAGAHGAISPATVQTVNYGSSLTFTITPDEGYRIANVLVDNVSAGAVASYRFDSIQANHTIIATFSISSNLTNSEKIAISGELVDQSGQRVGVPAPATINMTIDLFTTASQGIPVYSETFNTSDNTGIVVDNGYFTARLGDGSTLGNLQNTIRSYKDLWAQITINNETPDVLLPRTPLNTAPYSQVAGTSAAMTGNGDPNNNSTQAAVGTIYLDTAAGITWIRSTNNWVRIN
jgi:uncharacterized repeat protein (TIGR02543 family)